MGAHLSQNLKCASPVARRAAALEIASALGYLHDLNILHGDLAGGNILLTSSNKDMRCFTCKARSGPRQHTLLRCSLRKCDPSQPQCRSAMLLLCYVSWLEHARQPLCW